MNSLSRNAMYFRPVKRRALVLLPVLLAMIVFCSDLHAQLRSGRYSRTLYQRQVDVLQPNELRSTASQDAASNDLRGDRPAVVTASFADRPVAGAESYDVVGASGCNCGNPGCADCQSPNASDHSWSASCGCESCATGSACDSYVGDIANGQFADIAPMCTTICPPGTNPLVALWCRLQVRAELPLYWRPGQGPPPLVTTSPVGTAQDVAGRLPNVIPVEDDFGNPVRGLDGNIIGQNDPNDPLPAILLGGQILSDNPEAGFRLTLNTWLDRAERTGINFRVWTAGDQNDAFVYDSDRTPILARPFLNTTVEGTPEEDTQLIAFPGVSEGTIEVTASSAVDGLELSLRRLLYMDRFTRVDWIYGYQYASVDEMLSISSNTTVIGDVPGLEGSSIAVSDRFQTDNSFHGFLYGLTSTRRIACWKLESTVRLGLGNLRRKVNIAGNTITTANGVSVTSDQGLFARATNGNPFQDDTFVVLPEVGLNLAYQVCAGLDLSIGYNYLVIPKVAQAAQQFDILPSAPTLDEVPSINRVRVNLSDPLTGSLDPGSGFTERSYALHSLGFGAQLRY